VQYFPWLYRLNDQRRSLIWISNESDSLAADAAGFIPSFERLRALRRYASQNGYQLEVERARLHDLDWVSEWIASPSAPVNCTKAITAWNLFADIAASVGGRASRFKRLDSSLTKGYQKLFRGNNLPSMIPPGARYEPAWSTDEIHSMAKLLAVGLRLFAASVQPWKRIPVHSRRKSYSASGKKSPSSTCSAANGQSSGKRSAPRPVSCVARLTAWR
jgi:hypothetical protein